MVKQPLRIVLADIPLNLTTAFVYLAHIFGVERVRLVSSIEQLRNVAEHDGPDTFFILVPTIFVKHAGELFQFDVLNNAGSMSEMDIETVRYYLNSLVKSGLKYFIETNSNLPGTRNWDHIEVLSREIERMMPPTHKLLGRWHCGLDERRYVTSVYVNNTLLPSGRGVPN